METKESRREKAEGGGAGLTTTSLRFVDGPSSQGEGARGRGLTPPCCCLYEPAFLTSRFFPRVLHHPPRHLLSLPAMGKHPSGSSMAPAPPPSPPPPVLQM